MQHRYWGDGRVMYSITSLEYVTKHFTLIKAGTSNVVLNSDRPSAPAIFVVNSLKKGNKEEENKQIKSNQLIHSNIKLISKPIHLRMLFFCVYFIIPFAVVLTMLFLFHCFFLSLLWSSAHATPASSFKALSLCSCR